MKTIPRALEIALPPKQSAFLWGPRKTGKSTWLRSAFPGSLWFDLLETDLMLEFARRPALLREQLLAAPKAALHAPVIIDEVQKVPQLLDEVHWLIENRGLRFILCGSSARKLKRSGINLLGGRAWRYQMHPLTSVELPDMDLLRALNRGLVPSHYLDAEYERSLRAYVVDYLKEEVFAEGLARNVGAFSRFLDAVGYSHGDLTNYSNIARDCGVDSKTVREYYQILIDTLLGTSVEPWKKRQERQVIGKAAKFYLFDVGVAGVLSRRHIAVQKGEAFGRALEHLVLMELLAFRSYRGLDFPIHFWRTRSGVEVDFILGDGEVAIEVKGSSRADSSDMRSLRAFGDENRPRRSILVCNERAPRIADGVEVLPWRDLLSRLWDGTLIR